MSIEFCFLRDTGEGGAESEPEPEPEPELWVPVHPGELPERGEEVSLREKGRRHRHTRIHMHTRTL